MWLLLSHHGVRTLLSLSNLNNVRPQPNASPTYHINLVFLYENILVEKATKQGTEHASMFLACYIVGLYIFNKTFGDLGFIL